MLRRSIVYVMRTLFSGTTGCASALARAVYDAADLDLAAAITLVAAGLFGLVSGFNDGGNLLASFTSGRVVTPPVAAALLLISLAGPLVIGTAVARTIGVNIVDLRGQGELGYVLIVLAPLSVVLFSW